MEIFFFVIRTLYQAHDFFLSHFIHVYFRLYSFFLNSTFSPFFLFVILFDLLLSFHLYWYDNDPGSFPLLSKLSNTPIWNKTTKIIIIIISNIIISNIIIFYSDSTHMISFNNKQKQ